ncbi:MAG: carboxypeptidase regulatory-like domain-containing protein [Thermoplasmata archaeon]
MHERARRPARPTALSLSLVLLAALVTLAPSLPLSHVPAPVPPLTAPHPALSRPSVASIADVTNALPGRSPSGQPHVDVPAIVLAQWRARSPGPSTPVAPAPSHLPDVADPSVERPTPAGAIAPGSWVRGWVIDATRGVGVPNATVSVTPLNGLCIGGCATNQTDSGGVFNVTSPAGAVMITVNASAYLTNRTWTTVPLSGGIYVGRIYLVHDGYVTGIVRSLGPGHPTIGGVAVVASTRDDLVTATPSGVTAANGSFTASAPPLPSVVVFLPGAGLLAFLSNQTYANVTPYGTVDLGTVYLEGGFLVNATFVDRSTGTPIPAGLPRQLWLCTERVSPADCRPGPLTTAASASAYGIVGPAEVKAMVLGYVVNFTAVRDIPSTAPGQNVSLGPIYLTPMGAFQITSNFTGGTPPNSTWANGSVVATVCSLDGIEVADLPPYLTPVPELVAVPCWPGSFSGGYNLSGNTYPVGVTSRLVGPPLEDIVFLEPLTAFPVALANVPGPSPPPYVPTEGANFTWLNLTPDRLTHAGSVNLTAGHLVTGHVDRPGTTYPPPGGFRVTACSTDASWVCASGDATAGCLSGNDTFCVAAPPGPIRLEVTTIGSGENHTWLSVPAGCCGQEGTAIDVGRIFVAPNSQSNGTVNGTVVLLGASGNSTVLTTVEACAISPAFAISASGPSPCLTTTANVTTGFFSLTANAGWNEVTAYATGYAANWTWIDVEGANTTGTIELAPDGYVTGQVVTVQGDAIYEAFVQACRVANAQDCTAVGNGGLTSTYGQFYGAVPGAPFPAGAYEIEVSASGYAPNWAWANVSSGRLSTVPPIVLTPLGVNATPTRPMGPAGSAGAWVDGRVIDGRTGLGIPGLHLLACPVHGLACTFDPLSTSFGGEFNTSLAPGQYDLYLNASDHAPLTPFVNVTAASFVHLGTLEAAPFPIVTGRIDVGPWRSLTETQGLGPSLGSVRVCDARGTGCGSLGSLATDGTFNVSAPAGVADQFSAWGNGMNALSSPGYGFDLLKTFVNVTGAGLALPTRGAGVLMMQLFGVLSGPVKDGSVLGPSGTSPRPVPFAWVSVHTNSGQRSTTYQITDGGGRFVALVPTDSTLATANASASAFWGTNRSWAGTVAPAGVVAFGNLTLPHFGWVTGTIVGRTGGNPIANVPVQVTVPDPANATVVVTNERTNGAGFVNITAPAGPSIHVATVSPFYLNQSRVVTVAECRTSSVATITLSDSPAANGTWVQSDQVNTVGHPPVRTVVDGRTGSAVYFASVVVTGGSGVSNAKLTRTNGLGQFLTLAGAGPSDQLTVSATAYATHLQTVNLSQGSRAIVPRVNLTGDGIVEGSLIVEPGGVPAVGVEIMVCPVALPSCASIGLTNASGGFWVDAPPGPDLVSVVTESYLANLTASAVVPSDGFIEVGRIAIYAFADVAGTVLGLPTGMPIDGANVSTCSPLGTPSGPCFGSVATDALGDFSIYVPPATFVFKFSAPDFNISYRTVAAGAGASVPMGTIFLFSYGLVLGTVVGAPNDTPIANADLTACSVYLPGTCLPPAVTNASGGYALALPPGRILVDVAAAGYLDNFTYLTSESGTSSTAAPIVLSPFSPALPVTVSGRVTDEVTHGPIGDAAVTGIYRGSAVAATVTDAGGSFTLSVFGGVFEIAVSAPGYRTVDLSVVLTGNVTNEDVVLATMTYPFRGEVTDGSTGLGIPSVAIELGAAPIATTDVSGRFAAMLANGSYTLSAVPPPGSAYRPLPFGITVNGGALGRNLTLLAEKVEVTIHVESAASGLPLDGALVSITSNGSAVGGGGWTDPSGDFSVFLASGTYGLDVIASAFPEFVTSLAVGSSAFTRIVALGGSVGTTPLVGVGTLGPLALVLAGATAFVVALAWMRQRGRPPFARRAAGESPEDRTIEWRILDP